MNLIEVEVIDIDIFHIVDSRIVDNLKDNKVSDQSFEEIMEI